MGLLKRRLEALLSLYHNYQFNLNCIKHHMSVQLTNVIGLTQGLLKGLLILYQKPTLRSMKCVVIFDGVYLTVYFRVHLVSTKSQLGHVISVY